MNWSRWRRLGTPHAILVFAFAFACDWGMPNPTVPNFPEGSVESTIAAQLCERFDDCECDAFRYAGSDTMSCEAAAETLARTWIEAAKAASLTYSGYCMWQAPASKCFGRPSSTVSCSHCQIYHGNLGEGRSCESFGPYMSTCRRGLACGVDGRCYCIQPTEGLVGHRCGTELGDYHTPCADGLACLDGHCVVAAERDAECDSLTPCNAGDWCFEDTCIRAVLIPGQACDVHESCRYGLCDDGVCAYEQSRGCVGFSW